MPTVGRDFFSHSMYLALVGEDGFDLCSADSRLLKLSSSTFGSSGLLVVVSFEKVGAEPGSDRRRIDNLGAENDPSIPLEEPGLVPDFGEVRLLNMPPDNDDVDVDGLASGPSSAFCCVGDGLTFRHRFFAWFVTSSPISTTSLLTMISLPYNPPRRM